MPKTVADLIKPRSKHWPGQKGKTYSPKSTAKAIKDMVEGVEKIRQTMINPNTK